MGGGNAAYGEPEGTNDFMLLGGDSAQPKVGLLGRYLTTAKIFKCPADRSTTLLKDGRRYPRNRSCAMNAFIGTLAIVAGGGGPADIYPWVLRLQDVTTLQRPEVLVWSDTHEDFQFSCNFNVVDGLITSSGIDELPTSRHSLAATISFTDGHVESHRWLETVTRQPITGTQKSGITTGYNRDWLWLRTRMTRGKDDKW